MNECIEAKLRIVELESRIKETVGQKLEFVKLQEQHLHVTSELRDTRRQVLSLERELATTNDEKIKSWKQAKLMKTELSTEKEKMEELLRYLSQISGMVMQLKLTGDELDKEGEAKLLGAMFAEMQERLLCVQEQLETMHNLENQLLEKSEFIYSLQLQLHQANELESSSQKAASDAICGLNQLKTDLEFQVMKNLDQAGYIGTLETELKQINQELIKAKEEISCLNVSSQLMKVEFEKTRNDLIEAEAEIALVKSELHKGRSKVAAAEAAEIRIQSEKSALYAALQQLAIEANEAKRENQLLQEDTEGSFFQNPRKQISTAHENVANLDNTDDQVIISREEYEVLTRKTQQVAKYINPDYEKKHELQILKRELEIATSKVSEFRTRAEQAITRAEAAEKGKTGLEEQIKTRREQKERRKAALVALREEKNSRESNSFSYNNASKTYQPLGKILNMKF